MYFMMNTLHFTGSTGLHRIVQRSLYGDLHLSLEYFFLLINWVPSARMTLCQLVQFENICYPFILLSIYIIYHGIGDARCDMVDMKTQILPASCQIHVYKRLTCVTASVASNPSNHHANNNHPCPCTTSCVHSSKV